MAFAAAAHYPDGWPVTTGSVHGSAPVVADVEGDGAREIAVTTWDGRLDLYGADGRLRPGFPATVGGVSGERSSPALADIDGDRKLDVVVAGAGGKLYAYDSRGVALGGWPRALGEGEPLGPAIQEFTNYRGLEAFVAAGPAVYGFHANGSTINGWPVKLDAEATTMPAVGDLDGDRRPEVVVAAGDTIYAFSTSGSAAPGWPVRLSAAAGGAPILVDLDGDGRTEVVVGTTDGFANVLNYDGSPRVGWPAAVSSKPISTPAAVADFPDVGLAVIFLAGGTYTRGATLAAYDAGGRPLRGFPKHLSQTLAAPPITADVDGDGTAEIVVVTYNGSLIAFERTGAVVSGFPIKLAGTGITSAPAASDVDGDGFLDIVVAAQSGQLEVVATDAAFEAGANPWPMLGGNCWHAGKYMAPSANRRTFTLTSRAGEVVIRWTAADRRDDRAGWAVLRGVKPADTDRVDYAEIATVEEQPSATYTYRDAGVENGVVYYYKLEERFTSGAANTYGPQAIRATGGAAAKSASAISRCFPNPFTTRVNISYEIVSAEGESVQTEVVIYDISGKLVRRLVTEKEAPGEYAAEWDGTDVGGAPVASGVYLVSLKAGDKEPSTVPVVLLR